MTHFRKALIRSGCRLLVCGIVLLSSSAARQNPNAANDTSSITIRSQAELVLVPVIVTDKSGAHVSDLVLKDFEVTEDGKPQKVALFEEVVGPAPSKRPLSSAEYTNYVADEAARRLTIILFDVLNTPYVHLKPESVEKIRVGGLVYRSSFDVAPGEYTGRFVVRDRLSGQVGSVSAPIKISP